MGIFDNAKVESLTESIWGEISAEYLLGIDSAPRWEKLTSFSVKSTVSTKHFIDWGRVSKFLKDRIRVQLRTFGRVIVYMDFTIGELSIEDYSVEYWETTDLPRFKGHEEFLRISNP